LSALSLVQAAPRNPVARIADANERKVHPSHNVAASEDQ
jgi:hypothetical protein